MTQEFENKMITANTLNSQICIAKEEIKSMNNHTEHSKDKDHLNLIVEDASKGLLFRKKGENLS